MGPSPAEGSLRSSSLARFVSSFGEIQEYTNSGAREIVTQGGEVGILGGAADEVRRDGDLRKSEHVPQESRDG